MEEITYGVSLSNSDMSLQTKPIEEGAQTVRSAPRGEGGVVEGCPINSMVLGKTEYKEGDRQGLGFGEVGDPAPTISTVHGHAAAMSYDGYNQSAEDEVCNTLRTPEGGDNTAKVAMSYDGFNQSGAVETCHTLRTATGGESSDTTPKVAIADSMRYIVRRLTPLECERLMGYPEYHTVPFNLPITEETVEEFVKIHNDFNALMSDKPGKSKSKMQVRKWLEKIVKPETCSDAPRYKACGNGWAINCARFVLQGIDRYLRKQDEKLSP